MGGPNRCRGGGKLIPYVLVVVRTDRLAAQAPAGFFVSCRLSFLFLAGRAGQTNCRNILVAKHFANRAPARRQSGGWERPDRIAMIGPVGAAPGPNISRQAPCRGGTRHSLHLSHG
jgi:hypothetical protein